MKFKNPYARRSLWLYTPLWLFFVYLFQQILTSNEPDANNAIVAGMNFIGLGIHEASHLAVMFLPNIIVASAGGAGEIIFNLLIIIAALKARSYFAMIFGGLWLMLTLIDTGRYMADARALVLPLIGPSPDAKHDWQYVFGELNLLQHDMLIGGIVGGVGIAIGVTALLFGLWLLGVMAINRNDNSGHAKPAENLYTV